MRERTTAYLKRVRDIGQINLLGDGTKMAGKSIRHRFERLGRLRGEVKYLAPP